MQPILGTGNKKLTEYEQNQHNIFQHEKVLQSYEKFANELIYFEKSCTEVKDFRNIFDSYNQTIYFDNAHVKYQANEIIAENIFNTLDDVRMKVIKSHYLDLLKHIDSKTWPSIYSHFHLL